MSQIKKNIIYNIILTTSNLILPFVTFPYVTRVLAPEGIGQVNFATSFIQYFVIISALGIPIYGIRELARVKDISELRSKIFFELLLIKLICSILALIVYIFLIFSIPKFDEFIVYYLWGLLIIVLSIFDFNYFFNALEDFRFITLRSLFFQVLSVILIFVFIKTKEDALKYFVIPVVISLLNTIVNVRYALKFLDYRVIRLKLQLKRHLKPLLILFSILFFTSVYNLLNTVILGFITGNIDVGYYSVAFKISRILVTLTMALSPVMLPRITIEFSKENFSEIKRLISKSMQFVILLGVPFMVGLYVIAPELILLISGEEFVPSTDSLRIMSPIPLIIGIATIFSNQVLISMGRYNQLLVAVLLGTAASLALNFLLIPELRHNGASYAYLISEAVVLVSCFIFVSKQIKISVPYRELLLTLLLCLPFALFIFMARHVLSSPLLILLATVTVSAGYYLAIQLFIIRNSIVIDFSHSLQSKLKTLIKS